MVEDFDNVVFAMNPGERSPVFRTPFGFHIAEVRSKTPAGLADFTDVREDIERVMNLMAEQNALGRAVQVLRARATIRRTSKEEVRKLAENPSGRTDVSATAALLCPHFGWSYVFRNHVPEARRGPLEEARLGGATSKAHTGRIPKVTSAVSADFPTGRGRISRRAESGWWRRNPPPVRGRAADARALGPAGARATGGIFRR